MKDWRSEVTTVYYYSAITNAFCSSLRSSPSFVLTHFAIRFAHRRIGDINTRISTNGFRLINTDHYGLKVNEFDKNKQVGSWGYIMSKFVKHVIDQVIRSGAKSAVNKGVKAVTRLVGGRHKKSLSAPNQGRVGLLPAPGGGIGTVGVGSPVREGAGEGEKGKGNGLDGDISLVFGKKVSPKKSGGKRAKLKAMLGFSGK